MKLHRLAIGLFLILLLFTRFYNLPATSRFTRDESSNLMDMHRIYVERKITLTGPIDVNNVIIYPSLTFYMLMPFTVLGNFSTYSPGYGTAFYGVLAVLVMLLLVRKINKKFIVWVGILLLAWYPLIESSRWAWNPHLVPLISALAIFFWLQKKSWCKFVSGFLFGLAFHLHYFSLVSSGVFLTIENIDLLRRRKFKDVLLTCLGFGVTILPFIIFDLKNPPGLFFGRFLHNNLVTESFGTKLYNVISTSGANIANSLFYLTQTNFLALMLGIVLLILLMTDLVNKRRSLIYFIAIVGQVMAISFLPNFAGRYFLLGIVFFVMWLVYPRAKVGTFTSLLAIIIMTIGGAISLNRLLTQPQIQPGAYVVEKGSEIIANSIKLNSLKNVNLAVIGSPDPDPLGVTYRHTLLVKEVRILSEGEYSVTDNLFVVSTASVDNIRTDQASVINNFRNGELKETYKIEGTPWMVYLFNK